MQQGMGSDCTGRGRGVSRVAQVRAVDICSPVQAVYLPDLSQVLVVADAAGNHRR